MVHEASSGRPDRPIQIQFVFLSPACRLNRRRPNGLVRTAFLDDAGRLLDDGSSSPWTGRTLVELKASLPLGWPLTVVGGIDPLLVKC